MLDAKASNKQKMTFRGRLRLLKDYKIPGALRLVCSYVFKYLKIENIILIASANDFDMNGGALYDYLIEHNFNIKYKIIWLLKNDLERTLDENVIAFKQKELSFTKEYYRNKAKYIFYDNDIVKKVKKEQLMIYCGHATRAMKDCRGYATQPDIVDYVLSSSKFNDGLMSEIYGCPIEKMILTGFPATDRLLQKWPPCVPDFMSNKTIIWMPTFRKQKNTAWRNDSSDASETGLSLITTLSAYDKLSDYLDSIKVNLIIKLHPQQDLQEIHIENRKHIKLFSADEIKREGIETYKLLTQTDALISDYSSISFDYLLLDKPIAYVLSDYKEYKLGFAVENPLDYLPGTHIYRIEDLFLFIKSVVDGEDRCREARNKLKDKIHTYQDGKSCERLVRFLNM